MHAQGLSAALREQLGQTSDQLPGAACNAGFGTNAASLQITDARHVRIATGKRIRQRLMNEVQPGAGHHQ